ncbi:MAG TPA: hypothetical protein VEV44_12260 [Pseudoneobacillus sp.]|nr:hypothetical protein [Pseudoneobacillus sp.]
MHRILHVALTIILLSCVGMAVKELVENFQTDEISMDTTSKQNKNADTMNVIGKRVINLPANILDPTITSEEPMFINPTINEVISNGHFWFKEENIESKVIEAGLPSTYHFYLEVLTLKDSILKLTTVKGSEIEKDLANLQQLNNIFITERFKRKSNKDPYNQVAEDTVVYIRQILHDLDVALNQYPSNETFGVTHLLDKKNIEPLEIFITQHQSDKCVPNERSIFDCN